MEQASQREPVTVVVTEVEYAKAPEVFGAAAAEGWHCVPGPREETALAQRIRVTGARHAILGVDRFSGALYEALPRGGVLARFGVGYDGIALDKATAAGLLCTNTPGVLDPSVAEHTLALMLAWVRRLPLMDAALRGGHWEQVPGIEMESKRLAVIGCGGIGLIVARMAARGLGMHVTGCDTRPEARAAAEAAGADRFVTDYDEAVADADVVSLHLPLVAATRGFMDARRLAALRADAVLINTGRGGLVDEAALFDALSNGRLAGAALDVFQVEPYVPVEPDKDLRTLPNVVLTPHAASTTVEAARRMAAAALRNIALAEAGRFEEMDLLNPEVLG